MDIQNTDVVGVMTFGVVLALVEPRPPVKDHSDWTNYLSTSVTVSINLFNEVSSS